MGRPGMPPGRPSALGRDWTKGSISRNLLSLSWPMMISSAVMMMGPTIDMIWVGKLGPAAIAGVGVSGMAVMMVSPLMMGLFTGLRAMVARFIGAGDVRSANHVAQQAFVIAAAFSLIAAIIGIFLAEQILSLLGLQDDVIAQGAAYMRIQFVGLGTMSFMFIAQSTMQASGDALTPMKISVGTRLVHVALSPLLIFGLWLFPPMGVSGAALASVIAQAVGAAILLWVLFTGRSRVRITLREFRFDPAVIWSMVKIGIPASINGMERSLSQLLLVRIIADFGTMAVAAHSLGQRIDMFVFMPAMGLGQAAGVLAGQNLGAAQPERAGKTAWLSAGLVTGIMAFWAVAIWFGAESVVRIFSSEVELVTLAGTFLRIAIASLLVMGFTMVLMQSLMGVGDTVPPMLVSMLTFWLVQLPLALFLPRVGDLGVLGVRWAMVAGSAAQAISYTAYFRTGRWKQKKIDLGARGIRAQTQS
jgi:putative MATE family efflux protein